MHWLCPLSAILLIIRVFVGFSEMLSCLLDLSGQCNALKNYMFFQSKMYLTPYHIFWAVFAIELVQVLNYYDNLLVFGRMHIVVLL